MVDSYFLIFPFLGRFNVFYASVTGNHIDYNAPQIDCPAGIHPANFHSVRNCEEKNVPRAPVQFWCSRCENKITGWKACCDLRFAFRFLKTEPQS